LDKCGIQSDAAARSPTTPLADDDEIPLTLISADIEEAESGDSGVQRHKKPDDSGPREPEKEPEVVELANRPRKKKKKQRRKSLILVVCSGCGWSHRMSPQRLQGQSMTCPKCGQNVDIPSTPDEESPAWPWWVFGGGGMVLVMFLLLAGTFFGSGWGRFYMAYMLIAVPISLVIFFFALFLASVLFGAVELGPIHIALVKAFIVVCVINAFIILLPCIGLLGSIVIWVAVIMAVFRLDYWEALLVAGTNWVLNFGLFWLIVAIMLAGLKAALDKDKGRRDGFHAPPGATQMIVVRAHPVPPAYHPSAITATPHSTGPRSLLL
jgi:hypothetical protein